MEPVAVLLPEKNHAGAQMGEGIQKAAPLTGSAMRRKRFSDITNITTGGSGRSQRSEAAEQENPNLGPAKIAKDYIEMLLKENNALLKLVEERNKIIEISGMELQNLKNSLQKTNQQNWQLAQANSHMLAELNLGKDRLKALQHELGCTLAVLRAKTLELQEEKKLNRQYKKLQEKIGNEPKEAGTEAFHPMNGKKPSNTNKKKRMLRSQSLGPATIVNQETAKEKYEGRRKSLKNAPAMKMELREPAGLFEIEDLHLPIRSDEDNCSVLTPTGANGDVRNIELARRTSLGRPMRRAAEKINSYKEVPVNVKMRRVE